MHTPTPWKVDAYGQILTDPISGAYETICTTPKAWIDNKLATHDHKDEATEMLLQWSQRATDNAALIVKAVNSYEAMKKALLSLRNEVAGMLGIAENEIRYAIGYTNIQCVMRRLDEADKALTLAEGKDGE